MEPSDRAETLIVASSGRAPSLDELRALEPGWTEASLAQLNAAADAANRLLADNPAEAARFVNDPAALIAELIDAGVLTVPVDDLLTILSSRESAKTRAAKSTSRSKGKYPQGEKGGR